MKKYLYFPLLILSVLMVLTGCSSDDGGNGGNGGNGGSSLPILKFAPLASADSWIQQAESTQALGHDPQVMVVIFSLDNLPAGCSVDDLAAAFVGDQCRYTAKVQTYEGKDYGTVVMYRLSSGDNTQLTFTIRYYSQQKKGYYTSTPITFVSDETMGELKAPATLSWNLE